MEGLKTSLKKSTFIILFVACLLPSYIVDLYQIQYLFGKPN